MRCVLYLYCLLAAAVMQRKRFSRIEGLSIRISLPVTLLDPGLERRSRRQTDRMPYRMGKTIVKAILLILYKQKFIVYNKIEIRGSSSTTLIIADLMKFRNRHIG